MCNFTTRRCPPLPIQCSPQRSLVPSSLHTTSYVPSRYPLENLILRRSTSRESRRCHRRRYITIAPARQPVSPEISEHFRSRSMFNRNAAIYAASEHLLCRTPAASFIPLQRQVRPSRLDCLGRLVSVGLPRSGCLADRAHPVHVLLHSLCTHYEYCG